jgi:sugar phosphate permease
VLIRLRVHEPAVFKQPEAAPRIAELFTARYRRRTLGGLALALVALVTWWSCSAFIPMVASFLANGANLTGRALAELKASYVTHGITAFNVGGLLGTLLTIPIATRFVRRPMYMAYFTLISAAILCTFGLTLRPEVQLLMMFTVGLTVFGVFGTFTFYLPELFPVRLRGTGSGFCYNAGRVITSVFPVIIGLVKHSGKNPGSVLVWVAVAPVLGVVALLCGVGIETRGFDPDAELSGVG